ncbi:HNH endonuclease [Nonlabens spongiae]|uniref:HNH endonuclease n=1 Tax=Nonlabens spongiae TaxID=331648 RepID=A0A1W6ML47_9FLAO|nr:HNH endonuclease [Nonlabens spongiae]ARN78226.1 HNH endonuclease [Nonlabens spongiae]
MEDSITRYLKLFKSLKRGHNKGLGKAPHKPILLLSIIELIKQKKIISNRIEVSSDLVLMFKSLFKQLVHSGHVDNFSLPYFHLRSEPFYRLAPKAGMNSRLKQYKSIKSINKLTELIAFAEIDRELYELLQVEDSRNIIKQFILNEYFSQTDSYIKYEIDGEDEIENEILNETAPNYQSKLKKLSEQLQKENFEEEIFVRGGIFKKTVPKIYNYSCCVTGFCVSSNHNVQMVDACHIIPFSISQNDTIQNGISLSPNIHRAFDRGLLTINQDYIVRISPSVSKKSSSESLLSLEGKRIELPDNENYLPSLEALEWHRKEVFLF